MTANRSLREIQICKLAEILFGGFVIRASGFFASVIVAEMDELVVYADDCHPFARNSAFVKVSAFIPASIVALFSLVARILQVSSESQVVSLVVEAVAVYVVNFHIRRRMHDVVVHENITPAESSRIGASGIPLPSFLDSVILPLADPFKIGVINQCVLALRKWDYLRHGFDLLINTEREEAPVLPFGGNPLSSNNLCLPIPDRNNEKIVSTEGVNTRVRKGDADEPGEGCVLKEQKVIQPHSNQAARLGAFDLRNIHGELLSIRMIRRVLIKYVQPVVVVASRRWVRVGGVFSHSLNPINKWSRLRGSGLLSNLLFRLHFILSLRRILEIELKGVFNLAVQSAVVTLGAFYKRLVSLLIIQPNGYFLHAVIVTANSRLVKPQITGGASW